MKTALLGQTHLVFGLSAEGRTLVGSAALVLLLGEGLSDRFRGGLDYDTGALLTDECLRFLQELSLLLPLARFELG